MHGSFPGPVLVTLYPVVRKQHGNVNCRHDEVCIYMYVQLTCLTLILRLVCVMFLSPAPFECCSLMESHLKEYALETMLENKYSSVYHESLRSKASGFHQTGWDSPAGCWTSNSSTSGEACLAALLAWPCSVAGVQPC